MTSQLSELETLQIPIVDIAPLVSGNGDRAAVAVAIAQACQSAGFFYIVGHGIDLTFEGTYGDYVLSKVSKVFPELRNSVL